MKIYSENRADGLYEPENAIFRPFLWFSRPLGMKIRKNESVEQGVPGYGPQVAAMHTPPHAANLFRCGRGPIQNPDVQRPEISEITVR